MNIISKDNLINTSQSFLRNIIQSTSEMNGCPITNILEKEVKSIWLSEESLPQEILLNLNKNYFKHFPKKLSTIGIYCWHAYSTNPKLIEILISINKINDYISLGNFDLGLKPGMQLLQLDEDLLLNNNNNDNNIYLKIVIKETYGGKRTYINNLSIYEDINMSIVDLKSIQEVNDEEDNSVIYLRQSRIKNNIKKQKKVGNNVNNNNILLTSEILISDSDLSDRKIFGDKVDKFFGINNSNKKENNNNNNNKINNQKNIIKGKTTTKKDKSPIKANNTPIKKDKNILVSDKKSLLNSNIFSGNNNNNIINTQTSQNNLNNNNQLLTTEMLQNDFFTPEKQNKFYNSKGEISNIEFIGENQSLINEFRTYQKAQEEKQKKFEERIINLENKVNDINSTLIDITNNLNALIKKEKNREKGKNKEKEKDKEIERELILKECEQMIKITLIDILEKKLNLDEEKKQEQKKVIRIKNKIKKSNTNNNSNKIPESNLNKYDENFYQSYYNANNNQNTIDYSYNKNITLDPNDNYLTHKMPFYQNINNNNNSNSNSNYNSNNNVIFNHKRNSTFTLNYLNNRSNLDNNNINNSQRIKFQNKFNISSNNYSQISDNYLKEKIVNSNRTPMNISNYKIPHKNNINKNSAKNPMKLKKNKSNFSNLSFKQNNNTISSTHQNSYKILITKRQHSHSDLRSKEDIANKINDHLEAKFNDISDKLGKNINESLLKPSIDKLKKIMKKNLKQVRNSIKRAEINQRSVRNNNNYSYNS